MDEVGDVRSYTVSPPTVLDVKFCSTQDVIWLLSPPLPWTLPRRRLCYRPWRCPRSHRSRHRRPETTAGDEVVDLVERTICWNCASVGALSVPLKPPIAITGSRLASWYGAADVAPTVASVQR